MKRIKVTIGADGNVKIDAIGFQGAECEATTRELEESLGVAGKRIVKAERYRTAAQKVGQK